MRIAAVLFVLVIGGIVSAQAHAHREPKSSDVVKLANGDRMTGVAVERTPDTLIFDHKVFGRLEIPIESIRAVRTNRDDFPATPDDSGAEPLRVIVMTADDDAADDAAATAAKIEAAPVTSPDIAPTAVPELKESESTSGGDEHDDDSDVEWSSQIELGLIATEGGSETLRFRGSFRTARTSPRHTFRYDATYRLATDRGERSQNRFTTGAFSEWPLPETRWSTFLEGRYDFSEFQSWDHRISGGGGFMYKLLNLQREDDEGRLHDYLQLKIRGGAGFRKEFGSLQDEFDPEGILGAETWWRINDQMRVQARSTAYPSLDHLRDYRIVSAAEWTIDFDQLDGISLKLGLAHEYESRTDPSIPKHDLSAYATLMITF